MSFKNRFEESPLRKKWRPGLRRNRGGTSKRRRKQPREEEFDEIDAFNAEMNEEESSSVLQRAIMYQLEQKLPRLTQKESRGAKSKKREGTGKASNGRTKRHEGALATPDQESTPRLPPHTSTSKKKRSPQSPRPVSVMSALPAAPNLRDLTIESRMKTKKRKEESNANSGTSPPASPSSFLDQLDDYVDIDPKFASPFAPEKAKMYTVKSERVTLHSFDSDRAALDEYASLSNKCMIAFGGFGIAREKAGKGNSGWRSIWQTSAMYTGATAIPREAIERTEGCNYFHGDVYSMSLERRPKWHKMKASVAKRERMEAHAVTGFDTVLARSDHSTVTVKGSYVFVFGGKQRGNSVGGDPLPLNDVRYLDLRSRPRVWRQGNVSGKIPSRRWGHSACTVGSKMYVVGGIAGGTPFTKWNPYLDVSHNTSIPKRRNLAAGEQKYSPPKKSSLLFPKDPDAKVIKNAPPGLLACLNLNRMEWAVPPVVSHDMPRAARLSRHNQVTIARPPYALYGHSMTKVDAWCDDEESADLVIFGGFEWVCDNPYGEKLKGPTLSGKTILYHVSSSKFSTVDTWAELRAASEHRAPGPRSNHSAIAHKFGLFIFGGRRETGSHGGQRGGGGKKKGKKKGGGAHEKMILVNLEYLNDLCLLVREKITENDEGNASSTHAYRWANVDTHGKLPRPREAASMVNVDSRSILMYGGYSGEPGQAPPLNEPRASSLPGAEPHPWLNDFFVLRVESHGFDYEAVWTQILSPGAPCPRSGQSLLVVDLARADAEKCEVRGSGLSNSFVGETSRFDIRTFDETGEPRWSGRDNFQVLVEGPWPNHLLYEDEETGETRVSTDKSTKDDVNGINAILAHVMDHDDGTYTCEYSALLAGCYLVEVRCNGESIVGSPFTMWAKAGTPVPARSGVKAVNGAPLTVQQRVVHVTAGKAVYLDVALFDRFGNERHDDADVARLTVHALSLTSNPDSEDDTEDAMFWEGISYKTVAQIQTKYNLLWKTHMSGMAVDCLSAACVVEDEVTGDKTVSVVAGQGLATPHGLISYLEGEASFGAMRSFFAAGLADGNGQATGEASSTLENVLKDNIETLSYHDSVEEVVKRGLKLSGSYAVATVHVKLTESRDVVKEEQKRVGEQGGVNLVDNATSSCPLCSFLFHIYFPDSHETFAIACSQGAMIKLTEAMRGKGRKTSTVAVHSGDGPPVASGSVLHSVDKDVYKGEILAPSMKGPCLIGIMLDGQHVIGSPLQAVAGHGKASAERSHVSMVATKRIFEVGEAHDIVITAVDSSGLLCLIAEQCFQVECRLEGNDKCVVFPTVYEGEVIYRGSVQIEVIGEWDISVVHLDGVGGKHKIDQVDQVGETNPPLSFTYVPSSVCASKCLMENLQSRCSYNKELTQLTASVWQQKNEFSTAQADDFVLTMSSTKTVATVEAGTESTLKVVPRDKYGNLTEPSDAPFQVKLVSVDKLTVVHGHFVNDKMWCMGGFIAQRATMYLAHVTYGHDHVLGSPVHVVVRPSASDANSSEMIGIGTGCSGDGPLTALQNGERRAFQVVTRDKFKNRTGPDVTGQSELSVDMVWPSAHAPESHEESCPVEYDSVLGEYKCEYGSKKSGDFILNVRLNGEHVNGSPVFGSVLCTTGDAASSELVFHQPDLQSPIGTTLSWTLLEKDKEGNRRNKSSLNFTAVLKMVEWKEDPFVLREKALAAHKEEWDNQAKRSMDAARNRKSRQEKRANDLRLLAEKRQENFKFHVDRQIERHDVDCSSCIVDAMLSAVVEGATAYKDQSAPDEWMMKLYDSSFSFIPPPVESYTLDKDNMFGLTIEPPVGDVDVAAGARQKGTGEYNVPVELTTDIMSEVRGQVTTSGNGVYEVSFRVPYGMSGKGEVAVMEENTSVIVKGSPFAVTLDDSAGGGYTAASVEPIATFDRFAGIPIVVNVNVPSDRAIDLQAKILPLPKEDGTKISSEEGKAGDPAVPAPTLALSNTVFTLPPPDSGGLLAGPTDLSVSSARTGKAQITYKTAKRGNFMVEVKHSNAHIKGSPFQIKVLGGKADAKRCLTSGPGTQASSVNVPSTFYLFACDQFGNMRNRGGDKIEGTVKPTNEAVLHSQMKQAEDGAATVHVKDCGDGRYVCTYTPKVAGWNAIAMTCNGDAVSSAPLPVHVTPGKLDAGMCRVRVVPSNNDETEAPLTAIQLLEDAEVEGLAGYALRIVVVSRDSRGNDRRGKGCLEDASLFQIRIRRSDNLSMREPIIQLVPMYDSNGRDTGQYHGVFILETVGKYLLEMHVAEYTTTRLGRYGLIRQVTKKPVEILVKPGLCYPLASTLTRLTDTCDVEIMYNNEMDTCDAYASITRKDALKAGTSGTALSNQKLWYGPFVRARSTVDVGYHGVYMRSRQQLQDQMVSNIVRSGIPTEKPVFLLLVGGLGAGKAHAMKALNRYGRLPLEAFVWIDTQQITLQIPETKLLLQDPMKKLLAFKKTSKEAGFIAEIAVQEAMSCKKSVAFSSSLASSDWCKEWFVRLRETYPQYEFVAVHVVAPKEDVLARARAVERQSDLHISDDAVAMTVERSDKEFSSLVQMDLWAYYATIENRQDASGAAGPKLVDEGGTHAFSTDVAPSTIGEDDMEAAEIEQRPGLPGFKAILNSEGIRAPLLSPKRAVKIDDIEDARQWRTFCLQFDGMYESVRLIQDNYISRPRVKVARSIHIPRLMVTAGETSYFGLTTRDAYGNFRLVGDENVTVGLVHSKGGTPRYSSCSAAPSYESGRYVCSYRAEKSGQYILSVLCSGLHVCGSPFDVSVLPAPVDCSKCEVRGPALDFELLPAAETWFTIVAKDRYGNRIVRGGDKFKVTCISERFSDQVVTGNVVDRGDGRYEVSFVVPEDWFGEFRINVSGTEPLKNSPFRAFASATSMPVKSCFFDNVMCAKNPPVAGTIMRLPFSLPATGLTGKVSLSLMPFTGVQERVEENELRYVVEETSPKQYVAIFRLHRFNASVRFQMHLSCFGSRIRPADSLGLLPMLSAAESDPKACLVVPQFVGCRGLKYAAAGHVNKFRVQVCDRFGNKKTTAGDQFRACVIHPVVEEATYRYVGNGVYEFSYTLPFCCGAFAHSNRAVGNTVRVSVELLDKRAQELDDDDWAGNPVGGVWVHVSKSPFEVPVALPMQEKLVVVSEASSVVVRNARFRIWQGHGGHGDHVLAGRVGRDGRILIGDARRWTSGAYTIELNAAKHLPCRYRLFVPEADSPSLQSLDKEYSLLASRIPKEDNTAPTIKIDPPKFATISTTKEIPTLRVLKQGDIDVEEEGLKPEHIWWFAKKGDEVAAVMNDDGTLNELTLAMCQDVFGEDPPEGTRLPSSYKQYLKVMREYNKAYEEIDDVVKELEEASRPFTVDRPNTAAEMAANLPTELMLPLSEQVDEGSVCMVLRWSNRSSYSPKWKIERSDDMSETGIVKKEGGKNACADVVAFGPGASFKSLSVVLASDSDDFVNDLKQTLASVHIYQHGLLTDILHVSNTKPSFPNEGKEWRILQFEREGGSMAVVNVILSEKKAELGTGESDGEPETVYSSNEEEEDNEEEEIYDDEFEEDDLYGDDEWED